LDVKSIEAFELISKENRHKIFQFLDKKDIKAFIMVPEENRATYIIFYKCIMLSYFFYHNIILFLYIFNHYAKKQTRLISLPIPVLFDDVKLFIKDELLPPS
jgi:hypothetical protein